jgi:hypothetical protein
MTSESWVVTERAIESCDILQAYKPYGSFMGVNNYLK